MCFLKPIYLFLSPVEYVASPTDFNNFGGIPFFKNPAKVERASPVALMVKNPPAHTGNIRDMDLIPGSGRYPVGGRGNPLQYSCLENPMDRGARQAKVHRVTKSWTQMKRLSMHEKPRT